MKRLFSTNDRLIALLIVVLVLAASLLMPTPVFAQDEPTKLERATVATLFASSSISMVPVWITAVCTTDGSCRELNPVMRKVIGDGPVRAASFKAGLSFAAHYSLWRLPSATKKQRVLRFVAALSLLTINVVDAAHDVRVMRDIERRRQ